MKRMAKLVCWLMMSSVAVAAPQTPPEVLPDGTLPFHLRDCLVRGLESNLSLISARLGPEIAAQQVRIADSEFDVGLTSSLAKSRNVSQPTDPTIPSGRETESYNIGVGQKLSFGADWSAAFFTSTDDAPGFNFYNPFKVSGVQVTLKVPLLDGRGREQTLESLTLARTNVNISRYDLHRQAQDTMQAVENSYWDLVAARSALGVAERKLKRAQDLLNLNKKKVEVGTLAPIEITVADADVAASEEGLIGAQITLADAQDALMQLLALPRTSPAWDAEIVPLDAPVFERQTFDLEQVIEQALISRPEIQQARIDLNDKELLVRNAKRRKLPNADLDMSATSSGDSLDVMNLMNEGFRESVEEIPDIVNYNYRLALNVSIPLGNKAAKADFAIAQLNRTRSEILLADQELAIRTEVRSSVRGVMSGIKRVDAAGVSVALQKKKLEAEQKKFDNGMSTSFEVLSFQNDLADAELSEIRAVLNYTKALVTLEKARGQLLESRGLVLD